MKYARVDAVKSVIVSTRLYKSELVDDSFCFTLTDRVAISASSEGIL